MKSLNSYKNSFYSKTAHGSEPLLATDTTPILYCGYTIYKRLDVCFDIVKDGVCIGMYAGINGAKRQIDKLNKK
jgi:hypothetical protein